MGEMVGIQNAHIVIDEPVKDSEPGKLIILPQT